MRAPTPTPRANASTRRAGALLIATLTSLVACTSYIHPVTCTGGPRRCGERTDVEFCEYEIVSARGADCDALGLAQSKRFCVVGSSTSAAPCAETAYAVVGRDCQILDQRALREWAECSPGVPTFTLDNP